MFVCAHAYVVFHTVLWHCLLDIRKDICLQKTTPALLEYLGNQWTWSLTHLNYTMTITASVCDRWGLIRQRMVTITFLTVTQLRAIIRFSNDQVQTVVVTGFLRDVVRWTWLDSAVTSQRLITQLLSSQAGWRDVHIECLGTAALSHVWSYADTLRRNIPPQSQNVLVDWHFTLSRSTVTSRC